MNTQPFIVSASPWAELRAALHAHRWLLLIVVLHALAAAVLYATYPDDNSPLLLLEGFLSSLLIGPLFALCTYALYVMVYRRPRELVRYLRQHVAAYLTRQRVLQALPALLLLPVFTSSFTIAKAAVPQLHPYDWDRRLAAADQLLHGGVQPWVWLQLLAGYPLVTAILNLAYHLWFFIMFATMYWLILSTERGQLRMQFLLSFVLTWILLGNVMAVLLSSAGPCFYHLVAAGPDPYGPLMQYLHRADRHIPVLALHVQDMLWQGYRQRVGVSGLTISAMPSMHVASSVLLALLGWRLRPAAGVAFTVFAVLILAGSIHLGWHYAVDGYAGAAGAILIWKLVGWLQQRAGATDTGAIPAPAGSAP
ncbi:phosphatase PAP2 family protein [Rugamonas apoptosis]|uniref:Phosphatase PAP2 family protein n=1 Tax=Rugamonas apoptosis TaxID=2758570 RepID=A0A7W2F6X1_9BURK|nr:phosphatase PAP2 family protein [Rugamonas apoptosis]MBA5686213.1 phosphatase PAP2 family protein [Rugamonas apoptosis]